MELEWTLADRLYKSRRVAGLSVTELAERLDVHRNTITGWESGRHEPRRRDIRAWALATGVPVAWLAPELPRVDSNHQPAGKRREDVAA